MTLHLRRSWKRFSRASVWLVCVWTLAGLVALTGLLVAGEAQTGRTFSASNSKVQSVSELRAATAEDRAIALRFDRQGSSLLQNGGVIYVPVDRPVLAPPPPGEEPISPPYDPLPAITCGSDAIVVGHAVSSRTLLNHSETFLITVYEVLVGEWIRPSRRGGTITVAMLGGEVQVGDKTFRSVAGSEPALEMPALLFLARIPGTQAFAGARPMHIVNGALSATEFWEAERLAEPNGRISLKETGDLLRRHALKCTVEKRD
jgi:hypothetical protein